MAPAVPNEIPNSSLMLEEIPSDTATWAQIVHFAHTFDGDKYWGSRKKCAEIANARRRETLTELRTCLFFEQRRWNHFGSAPDADAMAYIHELITSIRTQVAAK